MRRFLICILFLFSLFSISNATADDETKAEGFKISSPIFDNGGSVPKKYTCDGPNVNPPLEIENVPQKAKSLALVFDDLDAPRGSYVHWILWNIDPGTREIRENSVPEGAVQGLNGFKKAHYGGPCPPSRAHRYVFKLYALDTRLALNPKATKADLEKAIRGHVIEQAQMTGVYKRK